MDLWAAEGVPWTSLHVATIRSDLSRPGHSERGSTYLQEAEKKRTTTSYLNHTCAILLNSVQYLSLAHLANTVAVSNSLKKKAMTDPEPPRYLKGLGSQHHCHFYPYKQCAVSQSMPMTIHPKIGRISSALEPSAAAAEWAPGTELSASMIQPSPPESGICPLLAGVGVSRFAVFDCTFNSSSFANPAKHPHPEL